MFCVKKCGNKLVISIGFLGVLSVYWSRQRAGRAPGSIIIPPGIIRLLVFIG
jgi:hypothetical protein